jgi:PAS domain S-box-containing protein
MTSKPPPDTSNGFHAVSDAEWERVFDALSDAVWLLDSNQRITRCNKASCTLFNLPAEAMIGRPCWEIVHSTSGPIPECPFARMLTSNQRESMELQAGDRWYSVTVDPLSPNGGPHGAVHILRDITTEKRVEADLLRTQQQLEQRVAERTALLAASERKFRNLIESTVDIPYRMDPDGILQYVGPQVERYGFKRESLEGTHFLEVIFPADRERVAADLQRALSEKQAVPSTFRITAPDGETYWFEERGTVLCDADGQISTLIGVLRDITQRRRAEDELKEQEQFLRRLMDASVNGIYAYDIQQGTNTFVNSGYTRITGYTLDDLQEMTGEEFFALFHPDDQDRVARHMHDVTSARDGRAFPIEYRFRTKDGRWIWCLSRDTVFTFNEDGSAHELIGSFIDITERKEADQLRTEHQRQLHHLTARLAQVQDEERRRIAEGLHDDVAQLLIACTLRLAVAENAASSTKVRADLGEINDLLSEAGEKIRSLSFELGSSTLYRLGLWEAIHELCENMCSRYDVQCDFDGERHVKDLDDSVAIVLFRATRELLFNIVKHSGTKHARVHLGVSDGKLELTVEDDGKGFPEAWTDSSMRVGSGLGLFEIKERLHDLGGTLRIDSPPGGGTRVTVLAPFHVVRDDGRGGKTGMTGRDTA